MKIQGAAPSTIATTRPAREVAPTRTAVTRAELRGAIERALTKTEGKKPSSSLVDVLTAQASLETASGERMYNYNFGGIKGHSPSGNTAVLRTHEVIDGKDVVIKDGFRAYATLDEGALDYVKTLKARFGGALEPAARGDTAGFAHALKKAGYYTAAESDYASALSRLVGQDPGKTAAKGASHVVMPLSTAGLATAQARLSDVLDADRFTALASGSISSSHRQKDSEEEDF